MEGVEVDEDCKKEGREDEDCKKEGREDEDCKKEGREEEGWEEERGGRRKEMRCTQECIQQKHQL